MSDRPEYVICASTGVKGEDKTWCGAPIPMGFHFVDASHAALNAKHEGRLLICVECSETIISTIKKGTY